MRTIAAVTLDCTAPASFPRGVHNLVVFTLFRAHWGAVLLAVSRICECSLGYVDSDSAQAINPIGSNVYSNQLDHQMCISGVIRRNAETGAVAKNISKLLCVIDPTVDQQPALQRAAWIATNTGAKLELFVCYYNEYLSGSRLLDAPSLKRARVELTHGHKRILECMVNPLRRKGVVVKTTVVWDHPLYAAVIRQAVRSGTDIVFKDTHHDAVAARALFSNTDWNLIRTCPVPLWLVKPHAFEDPAIFLAAIDPLNQHDKPAALDDAILRLSKSIAENVNGQVQAHLISGLAHEKLPVYAASLKDAVVVMGAVARNLWHRLFIGATAERTLEQLPCDLLVVKPDWFQIPVNSEQKAHCPKLPAIDTPKDKASSEKGLGKESAQIRLKPKTDRRVNRPQGFQVSGYGGHERSIEEF